MTVPYIQRSEWGAAAPKSVSPILDRTGGVVIHYSTRDAANLKNHYPDCYQSVRRHQYYHMVTKGVFVDLAYNFMVCPHGFAFVGRGWDARNGANHPENPSTLSICIDADDNDVFPEAVTATVNKLVAEAVDRGWKSRLRGHFQVGSTPCPGANIKVLLANGQIRLPVPSSTPITPPPLPPEPQPAPEAPGGTLRLVGPPSITLDQALAWAASHGASERFLKVIVVLYGESLLIGIDPAGPIAIAAHETNFGKFTGVLDGTENNWAGIKTPVGGGDFDQSAHYRFASDRVGARAVVQHVAAYAGVPIIADEVVDPRYRKVPFGASPVIPSDGWKWSSTPDAHARKIVKFTNDMRKEEA